MISGSIPAESIPSSRRLYSCFLCLTSRRLKDKRIERWKVLTTFVRALNPRRQPNKYPTRNARTVSNRQQPIKERKSSFMCDYVFFKLHDLSSIVSCVPIKILLKKVLVYGTYTMASAANARWLCCASNCELTGQESREDNSIHSATSLFTVLSLNHFSKRIKSSRLQLKFGGNIETNNRVINVVTYPNGYKRRLAIYEIIQLITDHTPKNIFHDRLIFIIEL